jgi:hypothetical protein
MASPQAPECSASRVEASTLALEGGPNWAIDGTNATLAKDTGFQGYEPEGVLTVQPKKSSKAGN